MDISISSIKNAYYIYEGPGAWNIDRRVDHRLWGIPHIDSSTRTRAYRNRDEASQALEMAARLAYAGYLSGYVQAHERSQMNASLGFDPSSGYAEERSGYEFGGNR